MGGRGSLRGDRAWGKGGVAGGLEQGAWGQGRVSKGLGAGAWRGPRVCCLKTANNDKPEVAPREGTMKVQISSL